MDDKKQTIARLKLAKGFFGTVRIEAESSEHEIRNALSRCYYSFFHLSHVLLGRYYKHEETPQRLEAIEGAADIGQFVETLRKLRIEADYNPHVVSKEYGGEVSSYRLKAVLILDEAEIQFNRMLKLRPARIKIKRRE